MAADEGTVSVEAQVAQLLADVVDSFSRPNEVVPAINRSSAGLQAIVPITEVDRVHVLVGFVRLLDMLTELSGQDESLVQQRAQIAGTIQRRYASADTPYLRSRTIVEQVAAALASDEAPEDVVAAAVDELGNLPFDEVDRPAQVTALVAVQSLLTAHAYLAAPQPNPASDPGGIIQTSLKTSDAVLRLTGFDRQFLVDGATRFRESRTSLDGTPLGHAQLLMVMLGIGLRSDAAALPALEPLCDMITAALEEAGSASTPEPSFADRCGAIVRRFEESLATEGFSEYLFRQGMADLKELKPETAEESQVLIASLAELADVGRRHAPPEIAQSLGITRDALIDMQKQTGPDAEGPLPAAEIRVRAEALLVALRNELASGGAVEPALTRALVGFQMIGTRVGDDGEDAVRALLGIWPRILEAVTPYLGPESQHLMEETSRLMGGLFGQAAEMLDAEGPDKDLLARAGYRTLSEWAGAIEGREADSARADDPYYQFRVLIQPLNYRMLALQDVGDDRRYDHAEARRIGDKLKAAVERIRAATTSDQWHLQQRTSLRPALVALRRFERRHHLAVIDPPWPAQPVAVDPNAVFSSVSPDVEPVVERALGQLGMAEAVAHGVDDPMHTGWDRLRRSAVAVFDFTRFDREASDPPGELPRSTALDAVARAAGPTAQVAYEYGWSLVLGVPTVAVARAEQPTPFDVDVEPARLVGDLERDSTAVALGIQAALIGRQRDARASVDLTPTIEHLKGRFATDASARDLLARMEGSDDATAVQLAAESLLDRPGGHGAMLALPAYEPVYPPVVGRRAIFHVTAFRPWSRPCEESLRRICGDAIDYRIGYEHLDPDIMGAIWRDLASAAYVVADVTLLNPNVALELGVAHALGRPTLVVTRTPGLGKHMPALAKVRTHAYDATDAGLRELGDLVRRFIAEVDRRTASRT